MRLFLATMLVFLAVVHVDATDLPIAVGGVDNGRQVFQGKKIWLSNAATIATLSANHTLYIDSTTFQKLDPGGSARDVTLPAEESSEGIWFFIVNGADAAENLVVKDDGGSTIVTIQQSQGGYVACSSSAWMGFAFAAVTAGTLQADGTVAGATSQAQDFGSNGIKADVVAESTATNGVAVDGVILKDTTVDVDGTADAVILDTDGDTTISADTDDTINIEVSGADDFQITANAFTALSGSVIKTDTINETTGANGVNIDSVACIDGVVYVLDAGADHFVGINTATDEAATYLVTIPDLAGNDTMMTLATAQTVTGVKTLANATLMTMGTGSDVAYTGGIVYVSTTAVGNVDAGEDDLITYSLLANSLNANNKGFRVTCYGTTAANANNKTVKLYLDDDQLLTTGALAANDADWVLTATVLRDGAGSQVSIANGRFNGAIVTTAFVDGDSDETGALTIKATGEATTTDDIVCKAMVIEWIPGG